MVPSQKNPAYKNTFFDNHAKKKKGIKAGLYQNQYLMPKEEKKKREKL